LRGRVGELRYPREFLKQIDHLGDESSDTHRDVISFGLRRLKGGPNACLIETTSNPEDLC
jgi:hypothetical protein